MAEDRNGEREQKPVDREERMQRIQALIRERGEDAAKMVKTWLQQGQDKRR